MWKYGLYRVVAKINLLLLLHITRLKLAGQLSLLNISSFRAFGARIKEKNSTHSESYP